MILRLGLLDFFSSEGREGAVFYDLTLGFPFSSQRVTMSWTSCSQTILQKLNRPNERIGSAAAMYSLSDSIPYDTCKLSVTRTFFHN